MLFEKQVIKMYRQQMFVRQEDTGVAHYFSAEDFEGLTKYPYSFKSSQGHNLQGYFYYYGEPKADRLVIFEHGMGCGHRAYMREIETIAKRGYRVFAYDHTGCMESGGENTGGFAQSLCDLDSALKSLNSDPYYGAMKKSIIGHSWGGFSTMNIAALHPEVEHIVAMSGFLSVERMLKQYFGGFMKGYIKPIFELEKRTNPKYVNFDAVETLAGRDVKAFIIHSADDQQVKREHHFDVLRNTLGDKSNIKFWLMEGKFHNPNYTKEAVKYKDEFFATLTRKLKNKELETDESKKAFVAAYDWKFMTQQDMEVWDKIFEFIEE